MKTIHAVAAMLLLTSAIASPALAATITYTLSGTASGVRDGSDFTSFVTFTGIGDTQNAVQPRTGLTVMPLSSLTASIGGVDYAVQGPTEFFANREDSFGGFTIGGGFQYVATFLSVDFASYDGISDLPGATGEAAGGPFAFATDRGSFVFDDIAPIDFSAKVSAVPEPGSWTLMIAGLGALGGAMRRRRSPTRINYAFR